MVEDACRGLNKRAITTILNNRAYDMIVSPQFSPDGSRLLYRVRKDGKRFVVMADKDGGTVREHPPYDMV